jgi:xylan 1,4-beta-xylosidase
MTEFSNPILSGFHPDPSVCRVGDTFYLANSSFEYFPGIPLHSSTDLVTWTPIGHAVDRADQVPLGGVHDSGGLYAPTLRHHDGVFYLACTVVGGERPGSFYLTATDAAGPWSDPVWLDDAEGIDPTIYFADGRAWWAGCRPAASPQWEQQTEIWLRELDLDAGRLVGEEHVLWTGALVGATWSEGPRLFDHDGWVYLVTAEGGTERNHAVSIARSRTVVGPFEGCPRNPILSHRHLGEQFPVQNVGHADLVETADGSWWAVALGVRPVDGFHILGRETFLTPVSWQEGWPVLNPGVGRLSETGSTPWPGGEPRAGTLHDDFTSSSALGAQWLSVRGPADFVGLGENGLVLVATDSDLGSDGTPAFLGTRLRDPDMTAVIRVVPPEHAIAGLALRQSAAFHLRLELSVHGDGWRADAIAHESGVDSVIGTVLGDLPEGDDDMALTAEVHGLEVRFLVAVGGETHTVAEADARILSTERAGGFVGTLVGPFVSGGLGATVTVRGFDYRPLGS